MTDLTQIKQKVQQSINSLAHELIEISNYLHDHPELAFQEQKATHLLTHFLTEKGLQVEKNIANLSTAFIAKHKTDEQNPKIAFLAEYDALPQLGHACGHNLIAASSVGAAAGLIQACPDLPGQVILIGTPAEENGGGKIILDNAGIFNDLDVAMMVHPDSKTEMVKKTLAMASLKVSFKGKAAHAAATPHQGLNALDAVILSFNAIGALRQQIKSEARIHGIITDGGQAPNIIPEKAAAAFYVRALKMDYLEELVEKVKNCFQGAAQATGTTVEISINDLIYAPFKPNNTLAQLFQQNLQSFQIEEDQHSDKKTFGSTDIGNVSQRVPAIHPTIAICEQNLAVHTSQFVEAAATDFAHQRMIIAAKALAMTALDLFYQPKILTKIKAEFNN